MRLRDLLQVLKKLRNCHPEADDAEVWATGRDGEKVHVGYVGYDKRHKPARIKLEE